MSFAVAMGTSTETNCVSHCNVQVYLLVRQSRLLVERFFENCSTRKRLLVKWNAGKTILFSLKHMCWEKLFHRKMLLLDYELFWIFEKHFVAEQLNWKLRQLSKNRDRWHMGRKKMGEKGLWSYPLLGAWTVEILLLHSSSDPGPSSGLVASWLRS